MDFRICYLIDDDPDEQDIFDMALSELDNGIQLIYEVDSRMAVKKLRRGNFIPDFIFIDINMPRLNGWECVEEIRKLSPLADIPIVIYSTTPSQNQAGHLSGCISQFIPKQADISSLKDVLQKFFEKHSVVR